jgi:hypothetical protein
VGFGAVAARAQMIIRYADTLRTEDLRPGFLGSGTGGRFELGLGAARPDAEREAARLGMPFGTPGERTRRIDQTLQAVRARYARSDEA